MQRFYFPDLNIQNNTFSLTNKEIIHQLTKVLRTKLGEEIIFFNGIENIDYLFIVKNINKKDIYFTFIKKIYKVGDENFRPLQTISSHNNSPQITPSQNIHPEQKINLFQALPNKLQKIEYIIQKGVEVGIDSFTFFSSKRSQKLILSESKIVRLEKIIIEAIEQSNQNIIPKLEIKQNFNIIDNQTFLNSDNLFFHTSGEGSIALKYIQMSNTKDINIFVGPEGGWDEYEILEFISQGFKHIYLGNNILRTETVSSVVGFFLTQK